MMKQFAVIGVDQFARRILEELQPLDCEILLVDKSREVVEFYKDQVTSAFIADVVDGPTIEKLIPPTVDGAIVDLGNRVEASILVTHRLKKMGVSNVVVKAETDQHGEILRIIGADRIIFPNKEAAKRMIPTLLSSFLFNYMPLSGGLVMAEVHVPDKFVGQTVVEANIRQELEVNIVALKKKQANEYAFFSPLHRLEKNDILLIVGKEPNVVLFAGGALQKNKLKTAFKNFFWNRS